MKSLTFGFQDVDYAVLPPTPNDFAPPSVERSEVASPDLSRPFILTLILVLLGLCLVRHHFSVTKKATGNIKRVRCEDEYYGAESDSVKTQLEGCWELVSYQLELKSPVRITSRPFGQQPIGRLIYTPDGYMSVNIMRPGCRPFAAENPHGGTVQENNSAAAHYMAYSGTYRAFERKGEKLVVHDLDSSLYPNWLGKPQVRICDIDADELVLRPTKLPTFLGIPVCGVLRWRRGPNKASSL